MMDELKSRIARKSTMIQLERAKERAEVRAEIKESRAAALNMKVPGTAGVKKSMNKIKLNKQLTSTKGWGLLRQKLKEGSLLPALRQIEGRAMQKSKKTVLEKSGKQSMADIANMLKNKMAFNVGGGPGERERALDAKVSQDKGKRQREERLYRRKLIKRQRKLERELEYLNFPTIMGWYFDGFFSPYFQLNEDYAKIFNQMEVEISMAKEKSTKETFAEKAKRYFWPPDIFAGLCFRTRGIYLDFDDIIKDPPHTPPDIVLDQRMEAVTLFMNKENEGEEDESKVPSDEDEEDDKPITTAELQAMDDKLQQMLRDIDNDPFLTDEEKALRKKDLLMEYKRKKDRALQRQQIFDLYKKKGTGKNDFYFDDVIGAFFRKRPKASDQYYWDNQWGIWRVKRKIIHFATDYYWDEQLALYFPKDRSLRPEAYQYDPNLAVFKVQFDHAPLNWRGVRPNHFYFDHQIGKWIKKSKAPASVKPEWDQNGLRFVANKTADTPDDYYFDVMTNKFEKKDNGKHFFFDPQFGAWRRNHTPLPTKGTTRPREFYWNEKENTYKERDAPSSFFVWDHNNFIFRKKRSLNGRYHPKNWIWNEKNKEWELRKRTGHNFISQSLHWVADRDYDKPWLEFIGGYKDYHMDIDYDFYDEEMRPQTAPGGRGVGFRPGKGGSADKGQKGKGKKIHLSFSEPDVRNSSEPGVEGSLEHQKRPSGFQPDGTPIFTNNEPDEDEWKFVDTLDRKTLKVTWFGPALADMDLRKYFASVKKVVRPKVPGTTDTEEDYAYLKFKTDEAAAAALKTMNEQIIKGTKVLLQYKLKAEDETVGGQKDMGAGQKTTKGKKKNKLNYIDVVSKGGEQD